VMAVEMLALVVAVVLVDGNSNGSQNRVSGGSDGDSGYGSGRQQQKLRGQAGNNQQTVAAVATEKAVVEAAIVAVQLQ
jgi:hypothetical protein